MVQLADGQEDNTPGDDGNGGADAQPTGGAGCGPFFFVKLGGMAGTVGTAQGASIQAR